MRAMTSAALIQVFNSRWSAAHLFLARNFLKEYQQIHILNFLIVLLLHEIFHVSSSVST